MFNDFKGFDNNSKPIKISVLPTLMISSTGIIEDVGKTCMMDFKKEGDSVYIVGETRDECGGSEFYSVFGKTGGNSPKVDAGNARKLYEKIYLLHQDNILNSCASVNHGFLITLAKMAIAGQLGAKIDINKMPSPALSTEKLLYSETQSRFLIAVSSNNKNKFEENMKNFVFAEIGIVKGNELIVKEKDRDIIRLGVEEIEKIYKERFKDF